MNVEQFIDEIFVRPALWDQKNGNHHNRFILNKLWDEVAVKLNTRRSTVRAKWKALRDKFRVTLASLPKLRSGDEAPSSSEVSWQYFERLQFLKDQFTPKEWFGNIEKPLEYPQSLDTPTTASSPEVSDFMFGDTENLKNRPMSQSSFPHTPSNIGESHSPSTSRCSTVSEQQKKSRRRQAPIDSVAHELLEPEKRKLRYIEENKATQKTEDEDLNFFKSILPHLKHLTPFEKMSYRVKILQVTQEFVKNTSQPQPSTSHDTHSQSHNTHPDVKQ